MNALTGLVGAALVAVMACGGEQMPAPAPTPAPAGEPKSEASSTVEPGNLQVAGVTVEVPAGCRLADARPRGGRIECDRAILDWHNQTTASVDDRVAAMTQGEVQVVERFAMSCQVGSVAGEGEIVTVVAEGHRVPMFLCIVPFEQAHSAVLCIGYDARDKPTGEPRVPEPCHQVIPWQPILVGPR